MSRSNEVRLDHDTQEPLSSRSAADEGDHCSQPQQHCRQWTPETFTMLCQDSPRQPNLPRYQCEQTDHITPPTSISSASSDDRQDEQLQNEPKDGSPAENMAQAPAFSDSCSQSNQPHETAGGQNDQSQPSNFHCLLPQCANISFKQLKDLRRHEKIHEPPEVYCGCCRNLGIPFKGGSRRDKLLVHMRKKHQLPGPGSGISPWSCPEEKSHGGQTLLFTTASCLSEHFQQEHPAFTVLPTEMTTCAMISTETRAGDELPPHDCRKQIDSLTKRGQSGPDKHTLVSPIEPTAKRQKNHRTVGDNLQGPDMLSVSPFGSSIFTSNTLARNEVMAPFSLDATNMEFASNGTNLQGLAFQSYEAMPAQYPFVENLNDATSAPHLDPYAIMSLGTIYTQNLILDQVEGIHLVDFLAIRTIIDFSQIEATLHITSNGLQPPNTKPVTYNVREETIKLAGDANIIEWTKTLLKGALSDISEKGGSKFLPTWSPEAEGVSSPRAYICDAPRIQAGDNGELPVKVFAIKPKDDGELVKIWMNSILPALPGILSRGLGGTYTASIVRRGSSDFEAVPWIQIESPYIPGPENRASIKEALNKICHANGQPRGIRVLFTKGRLQKLAQVPDSDTVGEDPDQQRLHFNLNRPCTKPGMGASLGLMCSNKVSATLGGYILLNGVKYILTSDHFVERSRDPTINNGGVLENQNTLVSPSLADVAQMAECLEQTERDFGAAKKFQWQERLGDRDIQPSELDAMLYPESEEDVRNLKQIRELLGEVKKPCESFTLGKVFRRSKEPRKALDAQSLGSDFANAMRNMDWAICEVNHDRAGENRHKYRSNDDAKADNYIHESTRANGSGEICHETCDIDPGVQVYYVGQKSGHREGRVNGAPTQISFNGVQSLEWFILDSKGQPIQQQSVEGDSGAWVIRKYDNKLMGQVFAYNNGQLLFTTIKDIFADIRDQFGVEVSLPATQRTSGAAAIPMPADPLCSVKNEQVVKSYGWLIERTLLASGLIDHGVSNPRRGSFSSLSSSTTTLASPVLTSPMTAPSFRTANTSEKRLDSKGAWTEFNGRSFGFVEDIEDQERPKTNEPKPTGDTDFAFAEDRFEKAAIENSTCLLCFPSKERNCLIPSSKWPVSKLKKVWSETPKSMHSVRCCKLD